MSDEPQPRGRTIVAGFLVTGYSTAVALLVASQLVLMSVFDSGRAERAAQQIAESRFTADVIEQTVVRAVAPVAGNDIAALTAATASADPTVQEVVEVSLVNAHRQIVDPDAPPEAVDANEAVGSAIVTSIIDTATANGIDLGALGFGDTGTDGNETFDPTAIARDAGLPEVVPADLPRLGLRQPAEVIRVVALVGTLVCGLLTIVVHPRRGRALRRLGVATSIIAGSWLLAMIVVGWVINVISETLFGEMIDTVWSDAVPSMMLLVGAGLIIGVGVVVGGVAVEGYTRQRRHPHELDGVHYERPPAGY